MIGFALKNWKPILSAATALILVIMLLVVRADARHWKKQAAQNAELYQIEQAKHAVTRASVEACQSAIKDQNTAVAALKAESDARAAATQKAMDDAQRAAQSTEGKARELEASAARSRSTGSCGASEGFVAIKGEL